MLIIFRKPKHPFSLPDNRLYFYKKKNCRLTIDLVHYVINLLILFITEPTRTSVLDIHTKVSNYLLKFKIFNFDSISFHFASPILLVKFMESLPQFIFIRRVAFSFNLNFKFKFYVIV